ncbi:MAG: outer membrane protein, partial [Rhizomicrobium sp.]
MKLRSIALAGAAVFALSTPALAAAPGWYLGLAVGYDQLTSVKGQLLSTPPFSGEMSYSGNAIYMGSAGYKWDSGVRLELELGYDNHDASKLHLFAGPEFGKPDVTGGTSTTSALVNFIYDLDLGNNWGLSLGGGIGAGDVNHYEDLTGAGLNNEEIVDGSRVEFEWQGIAGLSYEFDENLQLFADYRFRSAEVDGNFRSDATGFPVHVFQHQEHVALLGIRWYLGQEAPPPPPPPPPP